MLHLVSIDNLSAAAYRLSTPGFAHSLRFETPARVHSLVAEGHCDAALLPVASLPALAGHVEMLGDYGLACRGPVQSVQLFSDLPLETLLRERRPIYATPKSRTSVELFTLLCRREFGLTPALTTTYAAAAAHLLIGDAAYECAHTRAANRHNIDLSGWWLSHTGRPFVFARWVVSRSLDGDKKADLVAWLDDCALRAASPEGRAELVVGENDADALSRLRYYQRLHLRLDEDDLAGQDLFLQLMESTRYECTARIA